MGPVSVVDEQAGGALPVIAPEPGEAPGVPAGGAGPAEWRVVLRGFGVALGFFAASRLLATLAMYTTMVFAPGHTLTGNLLAWDSKWYFDLINGGYPHEHVTGVGTGAQNTIAFFPLYPALVRGVKAVTPLGTVMAGVLVSVLTGAVAVCLLWLLAHRLTDVATANRSVALFAFFPSSFAMLLLYPEGLMLALSIGCILCLLRERWVLAGVCAAFATAARPNAIVLAGCCAWAAGVAIWRRRDWKALAAPALAPMGIVGYFVFLWHHTGSARAWFDVQGEGWGYGGKMDRLVAVKAVSKLWDHPLTDLNTTMTAVALIMAVVGLGFLIWWKPPAVLSILVVSVCLMAFGIGGPASKMRYLLGAFPIAIAIAAWARTEMRFALVLSASAVGLGLYAALATNTAMTIF